MNERPFPPETVTNPCGPKFVPAPEVWEWIKQTFLNPQSESFNPDHKHLMPFRFTEIAFLWADGGYKKQGKGVVGTAEKIMINASGWKKERQEEQLCDWFGCVPDFLITLDARYCMDADDLSFCALIEHELYHIAQKRDKYGMPAFSKETYKPILTIRAHDVEEFIGVVARYGEVSENLRKMVEAANRSPSLTSAAIRHACGTCH